MAMRGSLAWLVVGAIGGAVGASLLLDDVETTVAGPAGLVDAVGFALGRDPADTRAAVPGVVERIDAYRDAQRESDVEVLALSLEREASRSWSPERDVEIDALLGRIAELAPDYAAALALSLELDTPMTVMVWHAWAEADADAALEGLAQIANPAIRRDVALALTDVFGNDARGIGLIAAALNPVDADAVRVAWLGERAAADPFGAFREAMTLGDPTLARRSLDQVAMAWAGEDPLGALAQADFLPANLAQTFRQRVFNVWARLDVEGYLAYLESQPALPEEATGGLLQVLATNPELLGRAAVNFTGTIAESIRTATLSALAARDPVSARANAESLPPGLERDRAVQAVASALAQTDPDAALDWVRGLSPPSPTAMQTVMLAVAQLDIGRAFEVLDDPAMASQSQLLLSIATSAGIADPAQTPALAEKLLGREDLQSQAALRTLVANWMQRDPEKALDWVLDRGTDIDGMVLVGAAQTLAARDPATAAAYVDRIPPAQRDAWIMQVATQYGRYDPFGAMSWVSQYQGQPSYDMAVRQLIVGAAQNDPRSAAQLLSQASPTTQFGAAQQVASAYAQQDPRAAARWAESLPDTRARESAVAIAVSAWSNSDLPAATTWTLTRPRGASRDQLLGTLFVRAAANGRFDRNLLAEFSTQTPRNQAIASAIINISRTNPAEARSLLASEVDDPAERARIEATIAEANRPR